MADRYQAVFPRNYVDREGKAQTHWMQLGPAFPEKNGDGYDCYLQVLPPPTPNVKRSSDGKEVVELSYRFLIRKVRERDEQQPSGDKAREQGAARYPVSASDDDIPF